MTLGNFFSRFAVSPLPLAPDWYALPIRLIVGFGFVEHGYTKLVRGPDQFIAIIHAIGVPFPALFGWATVLVELVGGLMILLGALVPLISIPMIAVLVVAIFTVHLPNGFSSIKLDRLRCSGSAFRAAGL